MPDEQAPPPAFGGYGEPWQPQPQPHPQQPASPWSPPASPWPPQQMPPPPAPNPGAWGQAPPPRRTHSLDVIPWLIVALVAALISGSVGYELGLHHSRVEAAQNVRANPPQTSPSPTAPDSGPSPTTEASGPCATRPTAISPAGAALLARMLRIPSGDQQVTALKQGVLSLHDYMVELYPSNPSEQARIAARCFLTAAHRTWQTPGGVTTSVWLIQFATSAGARSYTLSVEAGDQATAPAGSVRFTVAGVSDGIGLAEPTLDTNGNTLTRSLGDAGNVSIIVHIFNPAQTDKALASQVLKAQSARLGAGD